MLALVASYLFEPTPQIRLPDGRVLRCFRDSQKWFHSLDSHRALLQEKRAAYLFLDRRDSLK